LRIRRRGFLHAEVTERNCEISPVGCAVLICFTTAVFLTIRDGKSALGAATIRDRSITSRALVFASRMRPLLWWGRLGEVGKRLARNRLPVYPAQIPATEP